MKRIRGSISDYYESLLEDEPILTAEEHYVVGLIKENRRLKGLCQYCGNLIEPNK